MFSIRKFLQKNGTKKLPYNPGISPFSTTAVITDHASYNKTGLP